PATSHWEQPMFRPPSFLGGHPKTCRFLLEWDMQNFADRLCPDGMHSVPIALGHTKRCPACSTESFVHRRCCFRFARSIPSRRDILFGSVLFCPPASMRCSRGRGYGIRLDWPVLPASSSSGY